MKERIEYLDGHRGLAILLVVGYHAYVRWPDIVPYGDRFSSIPVFEYGWLGVQLFFLISGFVILMTLEKTSGMKEFLYRRWLRLFPGMLACSLLVFLTARYFYERPAGHPSLGSLVPGLTFSEPRWWKRLFDFPQNQLEASFWSLYVEVKFYIFAALVYFWKGRKYLIGSIVALYSVAIIFAILAACEPNRWSTTADHMCSELSLVHFGWFGAGAAFYIYHKTKDRGWFYTALCIALISSLFVRPLNWKPAIPSALISIAFALSVINANVQYVLSRKFFVLFGFISYPLYLIHENMMVSLISKLGNFTAKIPPFLLPLLPIGIVSLIAYLMARYCEVWIRQLIRPVGDPVFCAKKIDANTPLDDSRVR